tara:strand:+ start:209 stop:994 length:786 start_codon:yes stop_codon:yes gene_type:complete
LNYYVKQNHFYSSSKFQRNFTFINNIKINYYLSPLLKENNFIHAFFTKESSKIDINSNGEKLMKNSHNNCIIKQIHSNNIAFTSELNSQRIINADGLICDNKNQNLWIYTADCMPILFADKYKRRIAAIHCGRKGLEKNIILNAIKSFEIKGSLKKDILVAIGPSISGDNYLLDKKTFDNFAAKNISLSKGIENINKPNNPNKYESIPLDIKKYAYLQLLMEDINPNNIDISNKCTYSLPDEFYSWRRSKSYKRQWSVICS